uniref:Uncharacterized protein n=1 Tax=Anguilla anguilla TaxID=7936 RepID=A0A0E9XVV8_ANGAN
MRLCFLLIGPFKFKPILPIQTGTIHIEIEYNRGLTPFPPGAQRKLPKCRIHKTVCFPTVPPF